jgi:hypothetical protein
VHLKDFNARIRSAPVPRGWTPVRHFIEYGYQPASPLALLLPQEPSQPNTDRDKIKAALTEVAKRSARRR